MKQATRARIEAAGFKVGSAAEFLGLTPDEEALVETRLALSDSLRQRRVQQQISQEVLARKIGSSQSRVAKMEAGDPGISLDLLVRAFLSTGATRAQLGRAIAGDDDD